MPYGENPRKHKTIFGLNNLSSTKANRTRKRAKSRSDFQVFSGYEYIFTRFLCENVRIDRKFDERFLFIELTFK